MQTFLFRAKKHFLVQKWPSRVGKCSVYHREQFFCEDDFHGGCQRGFKLELASCPPPFPNGEPQMEKLAPSPHLLANSRPANDE